MPSLQGLLNLVHNLFFIFIFLIFFTFIAAFTHLSFYYINIDTLWFYVFLNTFLSQPPLKRDYVTDFNRFYISIYILNLYLCRRKPKKARLAADGSDGNGLRFENASQRFQVVSARLQKIDIYSRIEVWFISPNKGYVFCWMFNDNVFHGSKLPTTYFKTV